MTGESGKQRYELRRMPLARGVMGEVWLGWDREREHEVAVKFPRVPRGGDPAELALRFRREAAITAGLPQPAAPEVYHLGSEEGRPYLVMQRVPGISVSDLIAARGRLSVRTAALIAVRTCVALTEVHDMSLVHRDLKPANLMLRPDGTVTLLDFGLAEAVGSATGWPRNVTGTPAYPAPEQRQGRGGDARADLYGLGSSLHEMLTGRQPLGSPSTRAVALSRVPLSTGIGSVLEALAAADPADRPNSARDVHRSLLPFVGGGAGALTTGRPVPQPVVTRNVAGRVEQ